MESESDELGESELESEELESELELEEWRSWSSQIWSKMRSWRRKRRRGQSQSQGRRC